MKKDSSVSCEKNANNEVVIPLEMHGNGLVDNSSLIVNFEEYLKSFDFGV